MPCLKYVLLFIIALSGHFTTKAQISEEAYIYGSVKSRGGEALPGASVYIKEDLKTSTVSDSKGQFILKIESPTSADPLSSRVLIIYLLFSR